MNQIERIGVVTDATRKVDAYRAIFPSTSVVQVYPRFDEKILTAGVHHDKTRAPAISELKATEDLRHVNVSLGRYASALEWWANHTLAESTVTQINGKTVALTNDVHKFLPNVCGGITLEKPETEEELFLQFINASNQEVWLISGHTMMELGGEYSYATIGVITKARTRAYTKDDVKGIISRLGGPEKAVQTAVAGSISLSRDVSLFDTSIPLDISMYSDIQTMESGVPIASLSNWGTLDQAQLWPVVLGIWPEVGNSLYSRLCATNI